MPHKGKGKKGSSTAQAVTPKKRSRQPAFKSQPPPVHSLGLGEDLGDLDRTLGNPTDPETAGLSSVMDMLLDFSSRLNTTDHFMDEVKADKAAEAAQRESLSCSRPALRTTVGMLTGGKPPENPQQADPTTVAYISEAVRVRVASSMRGGGGGCP